MELACTPSEPAPSLGLGWSDLPAFPNTQLQTLPLHHWKSGLQGPQHNPEEAELQQS